MHCLSHIQLSKMTRRAAGFVLVLLLIIALCLPGSIKPSAAQGNGQSLPALPDRSILDKIVKDTGGPSITPLGIPAPISNQLLTMAIMLNAGPISGKNNLQPDQFFDIPHAVYFVSFDSGLKSILVPMANLSNAQLASNMQTTDGVPAFLLGGTFAFDSGVMMLVVTWKDKNANKPSELRVYTLTNGALQYTTPYKLFYRKFKGTKEGKVAPGDQGIILAARETCFAVGLDQVCYSPNKQDKQTDPKAAAAMSDAVTALSKVYTFTAKIDTDGALAEIAGTNWRTQCAAKLAAATGIPSMPTITECSATMAFAGVSDTQPGQPIGAIHLVKDIQQPAYDLKGNNVGKLTAGNYLIIDATPDLTDAGTPAVLILVNTDGKSHFLIPSQVIEGFADSDDKDNNSRKGQAGIKDATVGAHGF